MADVNTTQVVTGSGAAGQAAAGNTGVTGQAAADGSDKTVPYARFHEVNEKAKTAEAQVQTLNQQVQQMAVQLRVIQANAPKETKMEAPKGAVRQAIQSLGLGDENYLTKDQMADVVDHVLQQQMVQNQQQAFIAAHSDYEQVVGRADPVTGQFVMADPLKKVLTENPALQTALQGNPHAGVIAYELAKHEVAAAIKNTTKEAKAAIEAAGQAISISNVSGGGNMDKVAAMQGMNDADFAKHKEAVKARAT